MRAGSASGFRAFPNSLQGGRLLNKHIDHQRHFQNKIFLFGGYDNNCYPVWNGTAYVSSCGLLYDYW
jgi:hypothetical protein